MDDRLQPATKGDTEDLRSEMRGMEEPLTETFRGGQTELLKGFYGFMQTIQQRFEAQDQMESNLKKRMTTIESRILEIEKKLNIPPSAA